MAGRPWPWGSDTTEASGAFLVSGSVSVGLVMDKNGESITEEWVCSMGVVNALSGAYSRPWGGLARRGGRAWTLGSGSSDPSFPPGPLGVPVTVGRPALGKRQ
jgi:hypothetical protein